MRWFMSCLLILCLVLLSATTTPACTSVRVAYQRFILQTATGLHQTTVNSQFLVATNRDLFYIKKRNTGSRTTEVHVLSAQSNYQTFTLHTKTALHETGDDFEFGLATNRDVFAIKKYNTGTRSTEVHILSAASGYQSFSLQTGTPIGETRRRYDYFFVAANRDLVLVHGGLARVEVHILTAASRYKSFSAHIATKLNGLKPTLDYWRYAIAPNRNLVAISMKDTGTCKTEVHVLPAATNYQSFRLQTGTVLHQTDTRWQFVMAANSNDLFCVKRWATSSRKTELHVMRR